MADQSLSLDRRAWRRTGWALLVFVALNAAYWLLYAYARPFSERWMRGEDKFIEWVTFFGFAVAGVLGLTLTRHRATRWVALWCLGLGLFFVICAGEEISWGQRIFGFGTPEAIHEINKQGEFNLHNIEKDKLPFSPVAFVSYLLSTFGILAPIAIVWRRRGETDPWRHYLPPPAIAALFLFAHALSFTRDKLGPWLRHTWSPEIATVVKLDTMEFKEMVWGVSCALAMWALRDFARRRAE